MKKVLHKKVKLLAFLLITFSLSSCLKEMPEKGLHISVPENNPIQNLQTLLRDEEKTKVLLLGVPPLSVLSNDFSPSLIERIVKTLSDFKPDVICLDAVSPEEIASNLESLKELNQPVTSKEELFSIKKLRNKFKLSSETANNELDSLLSLSANKSNLDSKLRERIIELFLFKFDLYSAALNLKYLSENEIHKLKINDEILSKLKSLLNQNDEKTSIGLRVAYQLKMNRVYSINDISDKIKLNKISEKLYKEMLLSDVYNSHRNEILNQVADSKLKEGISKQDLFDFFLYLNSDSYAITSTNNNWSIYYKMFLESGLDRTRIGLWEMKNLRIASNIREVSADYPGKKVLVIIDVSKKVFVEEYLKKMTDIKILGLRDIIS
jgi:hypothetical protein